MPDEVTNTDDTDNAELTGLSIRGKKEDKG